VVQAEYEPGLHFKIPVFQDAKIFDHRILSLNAEPERYFTAEKKSINVDFYVKWRIDDTDKYYRATGGNELNARQRLAPIIKNALRFEFNSRPLDELISGGREDVTRQVLAEADTATRKNLGIEVVDVRIKRIDLPEGVSESVYQRMRAERKDLANKLRSTGKEQSEIIRSDADRQRQVLLAEAQGKAAGIRGEGDAKAAGVWQESSLFRLLPQPHGLPQGFWRWQERDGAGTRFRLPALLQGSQAALMGR
ncbi:MAG: protease modulator HflC, partial [Nitrococcus sp.]|nr:protease modulator HflC [Nitrococcus sp.]